MKSSIVPALAVDSQPNTLRGMSSSEMESLLVSTLKIDGQCHVLSRYGDDVWYLEGGTTNRASSSRALNFLAIPHEYRGTIKALMYRYMRRGRRLQRRPGPRALVTFLEELAIFLKHASARGAKCVKDISPVICSTYAQSCDRAKKGKRLTPKTVVHKLTAVEALFELSQYTDDAMSKHPWPDGLHAALVVAKAETALAKRSGGKTPLIPDDVFCRIFQRATEVLDSATNLLDIRDQLQAISDAEETEYRLLMKKRAKAQEMGYSGSLLELEWACNEIRTASYVVIASLSGCRNHELAFLKSGACYKTLDEDGETFWWMRSQSLKTHEGHTEWMIPEVAVKAISLMERWAAPFQQELADEIARLRREDPTSRQLGEAQKHVGAIFVGRDRRTMLVRTLTNGSWQVALRNFLEKAGISWKIGTHQFRRKFANYAARSQFGDLRYLKQHFKHWSLDMTLGYAMNELQEVSLYSEVFDELADIKESVIDAFLSGDEPLAGGLGVRLVEWRGNRDVVLFPTHSAMVKAVSDGIALRSNGHAWCTADKGIDCVGNGGLDRSRCADCDHAVIGRVHARVYAGVHEHLLTLRACTDIGEGGRARVERDIARCEAVLSCLGVTINGEKV